MNNYRNAVGWTAVAVSTLFASLWAFWGAIETFHEGWYYRDWKLNVALTAAQYLLPLLLLMTPALTGLRWPRAGAMLHFALALSAFLFFRGLPAALFITVPLAVLGALYFYGRPEPRNRAVLLVTCLPLLTWILSGAYPAYLAFDRYDDGDYGARTIHGNGVALVWAPEGPGWPETSANWFDAQRNCAHLDSDGRKLLPEPRGEWRLPTAEEAVRSAVRRGANAGGKWDAETRTATYQVQPNKDSPLWKKYSKMIYWWTADAADERTALRIVWNGQVQPAPKKANWGYLGYRCVKNPETAR